ILEPTIWSDCGRSGTVEAALAEATNLSPRCLMSPWSIIAVARPSAAVHCFVSGAPTSARGHGSSMVSVSDQDVLHARIAVLESREDGFVRATAIVEGGHGLRQLRDVGERPVRVIIGPDGD